MFSNVVEVNKIKIKIIVVIYRLTNTESINALNKGDYGAVEGLDTILELVLQQNFL